MSRPVRAAGVVTAVAAALLGAATLAAQPLPSAPTTNGAASATPPAVPTPPADAGAPPPRAPRGTVAASCVEHLPAGATRPEMSVTFPARGLSGYEARLEVVVRHGAGETVLPEGLRVQRDSDAFRAVTAAHFVIPDPDGGSAARIEVERSEARATTTLSLPFVPLPPAAGRHELELPPIPIAVARASGELVTLCTAPQRIVVEDPVASEADPQVKPNPPPRPQREPWQAAKIGFFGGLGLVALALLLGWLLHRWLSRPRPAPVVPKPLPWVAALEELERIRRSGLLEEGRRDEHYDRVNDCVRLYLGERYGFDGLESTTDEMRRWLGRVRPRPPELTKIVRYLEDADLIKFADVSPSDHDCRDALGRAERIVRVTTPRAEPTPPATETKSPSSGPDRASSTDAPADTASIDTAPHEEPPTAGSDGGKP
jgi:hypothetical protein